MFCARANSVGQGYVFPGNVSSSPLGSCGGKGQRALGLLCL